MQVKSQGNAQTKHKQQTFGWMQGKVNHLCIIIQLFAMCNLLRCNKHLIKHQYAIFSSDFNWIT